MFERVKSGPMVGEFVRLRISETNVVRDNAAPRNPYVTGYGKKIPTSFRVQTINNKWRRVYCAFYSNNGTLYVMHGKHRTIVELPC